MAARTAPYLPSLPCFAPQQLLNGTCQWDWGQAKCAYSTYNCANVSSIASNSSMKMDNGLVATCAAKNVTSTLKDLAVYNSSVCYAGEWQGTNLPGTNLKCQHAAVWLLARDCARVQPSTLHQAASCPAY